MTPTQAAKIIGCSPQQIRTLCRTGKMLHRRVPTNQNQHGYYYEITKREAERYRDKPQTVGFPRGKKRI